MFRIGIVTRFQIDTFADLQAAAHQLVALVEIPDELAEGFASLVRRIEDPLLHAQEVLEFGLVVEDVDQTDVLLMEQAVRLERQVALIHQIGRHIAQGVDEQIDIHAAGPVANMLSAVWKSTGVTMVIRFCTVLRVDAAKHSEKAPPWQTPSRLIASKPWLAAPPPRNGAGSR